MNVQIDNSAKEVSAVASKLDTAMVSLDKATQLAQREARLAEREAAVLVLEKDQDKKLAAEIAALREVVNTKCGGETIVHPAGWRGPGSL